MKKDGNVLPFTPKPADQLPSKASADGDGTSKVVFFVDAGTRAIRQEAIRRVRASGIFKLPGDR